LGLSRDRSFLLTSSRLGDRASRRLPAACVHVPCMSWCSVPPRFSPGADRHSPCPSLSFPFHGRSLIAPTVTVCSTVAGMPRPRATCVDSARAAPTACCSFAPLGPPWCPCLLSPPWPRYRFVCATRRSTASHRRRAETRGAVSFVVFSLCPLFLLLLPSPPSSLAGVSPRGKGVLARPGVPLPPLSPLRSRRSGRRPCRLCFLSPLRGCGRARALDPSPSTLSCILLSPSPVVGAPLPSRAVWLRAAPGGRNRPSA